MVPGGKTAYLSELKSGSEVLVADAAGRTRTAVVGRCKVEARPMVLVEATVPGGAGGTVSTLLQNAETVRLVGPSGGDGVRDGERAGGGTGGGGGGHWRAVSVSQLAAGDKVRRSQPVCSQVTRAEWGLHRKPVYSTARSARSHAHVRCATPTARSRTCIGVPIATRGCPPHRHCHTRAHQRVVNYMSTGQSGKEGQLLLSELQLCCWLLQWASRA
jgi:hypothetical protein